MVKGDSQRSAKADSIGDNASRVVAKRSATLHQCYGDKALRVILITIVRVVPSESIARRVRNEILASQERHWRIEDLGPAEEVKAINHELRRLVEAGEIERVRRGVYWRGRPTRFGMTVGSEAQAARAKIDPGEAVGAAEWYATNLLGLSTQVSPIEVLAVTRRGPRGFKRVRFVTRAARTGRREQELNDLEVTILEALYGWDRFVELGPGEAVERFSELLSGDAVRLEAVVRASATEEPATRERLRAVLQRMGREDLANRVPRARDNKTRERALRVLRGA